MYVSIGLLYAMIPVFATALIAFVVWLVRTSGKQAELISSIVTGLNSQGDRLKRLEGWQDGVQFGRSIESAKHIRESGATDVI